MQMASSVALHPHLRGMPHFRLWCVQWVTYFGDENSGTYNNQYLIVDYKLFEAGAKALKPGLFWVLEQYPGQSRSSA